MRKSILILFVLISVALCIVHGSAEKETVWELRSPTKGTLVVEKNSELPDDIQKIAKLSDDHQIKYSEMPLRKNATADAAATYAAFHAVSFIRPGMTFQELLEKLNEEHIQYTVETASVLEMSKKHYAHDYIQISFSTYVGLALVGYPYHFELDSVVAVKDSWHIEFEDKKKEELLQSVIYDAELVCYAPYMMGGPDHPSSKADRYNPFFVMVDLKGMIPNYEKEPNWARLDEIREELIALREK